MVVPILYMLCDGKSHLEMNDLELPLFFRKPPHPFLVRLEMLHCLTP